MRKTTFFIIAYIFLAVISYIFLFIKQQIVSDLVLALLYPLLVLIPLVLISKKNDPINMSSGYARYNLHCKSCGWDWMSNLTKKAPSQCPNCRGHNLGIMGWKSVEVPMKKRGEDLKKYLKNQ